MAAAQAESNKNTGVIRVTNLPHSLSEETIKSYFENRRLTGGGNVDRIVLSDDKESADVVFEDHSAVDRIMQKLPLVFKGKQICVVKINLEGGNGAVSVETYKNKILVKGINPNTTKKDLQRLLESKTGEKVTDIEYNTTKTIAIVSFENSIDVNQLRNSCQISRIDDHTLSIDKVPVSDCIHVTNIDPKTFTDSLQYFFENSKRVGGGDIYKIERSADQTSCLIYFEDENIVETVCSRKPWLYKRELKIKIYHEILQGSDNSTAQSTGTIPEERHADVIKTHETPEPICVVCRLKSDQGKYKTTPKSIPVTSLANLLAWKFILNNQTFQSATKASLCSLQTDVVYDEDFGLIKVTCNKVLNAKDGEELSWWSDFIHVMENHVEQAKVYALSFPNSVPDNLKQSVLSSPFIKSGSVHVDSESVPEHLLLVGIFEHISTILLQVKSLFVATEVKNLCDNTTVSYNKVPLTEEQKSLMQKFSCKNVIEKRYKNVCFELDAQEAYLIGPLNSLNEIQTILACNNNEWLANLVHCQTVELDETCLKLYSNPTTRTYVDDVLNRKVAGVFMLDVKSPGLLVVYAENQKVSEAVESGIVDVFHHKCLRVKSPSNWKNEVEKLTKKYDGKLHVDFPPAKGHEVILFATHDVFQADDFICLLDKMSNDVMEESESMEIGADDFVLHDGSAMKQIEDFCTNEKVLIYSPAIGAKTSLLLCGTPKGIERTKAFITQTISNVKEQYKKAQKWVSRQNPN